MTGPDDSDSMALPELPVGPRVDTDKVATAPTARLLRGRDVELHPVDPSAHADALFVASHGDARREALWTYLFNGPFESADAMRAWLRDCRDSTDVAFFTVLRGVDGRPIGMAALQRFDPVARCVEIAHVWYGPDYQRTAANTEATYLMLKEGFERLGCRRVEWKCDALNARSRAAALRLGFEFEGLFRQHMIIKGRSRDTAWFAMIDSDWPSRRSNLERALYSGDAVSLTELNRPRPRQAAVPGEG